MRKRRRGWTERKREVAHQKAKKTLRKRRDFIVQAKMRSETRFAGIIPFMEYGDKMLQIREKLREHLEETKGKNATFKSLDVALGMITLLQMGLRYLEHIPHYLEEVKIAERLNLPHFFSEDVVRNWLQRKPEEQSQGLKRLAQDYILAQELPVGSRWEVDVDQTAIASRARKREGVHAGYGMKGHQAKPCFQAPRVSVNGMNFDWALKAGTEHCSGYYDRALETAETLLAQSPGGFVLLRSDTGFASAEHLRRAQELSLRFPHFRFILAAAAAPAGTALVGLLKEAKRISKKRWRKVSSSTSVLELSERLVYQHEGLKTRVAVIRKKMTRTKRLSNRKGHVRKQIQDHYYFLLTNYFPSESNAQHLFRDYHGRQAEEQLFRDSKGSGAFLHLPDQTLAANELYLSLVLLSQVLMRLYQRQVLPKTRKLSYTQTIHDWFIQVGGKNRIQNFDSLSSPLSDSPRNTRLDQTCAPTITTYPCN